MYNRATTFDAADYYTTAEELEKLIRQHKDSGDSLQTLAYEHYTWKHIASEYEKVYKLMLS